MSLAGWTTQLRMPLFLGFSIGLLLKSWRAGTTTQRISYANSGRNSAAYYPGFNWLARWRAVFIFWAISANVS